MYMYVVFWFTACTDDGCSMDKWLSKLESSNWLSHVKEILTCACTVAQCIDSEGKYMNMHSVHGLYLDLWLHALYTHTLVYDYMYMYFKLMYAFAFKRLLPA